MKKKTHKKITILVILLALGVAGAGYAFFMHRNNKDEAKTTSTAESAQNDYRGDDRHSEDGNTGNFPQGGAIDNKGDTVDDSGVNGLSSASGAVTVLNPVANSVFKTGSTIRGRVVNVTRVQYRVSDDNVGVIAQGALDVVNGSFSGTMQFSTKGNTGRVDIFTYNQNYNEENSVQVPVRFKD